MKISNKLLINIKDKEEIKYYEEIGITNFLFAVKDFSIGYPSFDLKDIPDNAYLFMNRLLDTKDILKLKSMVLEFKRFKGIIFEDLGVFNILKDSNLELIIFENHFGTNHKTINFFLDNGCTSAVINNEITEHEIESIISKAKKPLILTVLAKNQIMYSRRKLLTNFTSNFNLKYEETKVIRESVSNSNFLVKETDYGTVLFNNTYFNYLHIIDKIDDNLIKFYLIMNLDLEKEKIKDILEGLDFGDSGYLYKETVVNMKDYK